MSPGRIICSRLAGSVSGCSPHERGGRRCCFTRGCKIAGPAVTLLPDNQVTGGQDGRPPEFKIHRLAGGPGPARAWLRTVVLARLGEPQAVDEVMQEVALAAVEQRSPLSDPEKVRSLAVPIGGVAVAVVSPAAGTNAEVGRSFCGPFPPDRSRLADDGRPGLAAARRAAANGAAGVEAAAAARRGDLVAEVHGRLELPPDRRPPGNRTQRGRSPAASGARKTAKRVVGFERGGNSLIRAPLAATVANYGERFQFQCGRPAADRFARRWRIASRHSGASCSTGLSTSRPGGGIVRWRFSKPKAGAAIFGSLLQGARSGRTACCRFRDRCLRPRPLALGSSSGWLLPLYTLAAGLLVALG